MTLAVAAGTGTLPATAQPAVRQSEPSTNWDVAPGFPRPAEGLSTWMATFADPTAGPGQAPPNYAYFLDFTLNLVSADLISYGRISLDVVGSEKFASLTITESAIEGGRSHRVRVPFGWKANSFYFLWVNRLADGLFGGWAYDATAASWTYIGAVAVPPHLAYVDSDPRTGVAWTGPPLGACNAYPQAVVVAMAPVAYYNSTPTPSHLRDRQVLFPSDCPSTAAFFVPGWDYYVAGSAPPAVGAA